MPGYTNIGVWQHLPNMGVWQGPRLCHVINRGQDGNIDYTEIMAVMGLSESQVSIEEQDLPANTIWHYVRRQVSGCGLVSADSPVCIVRIDASGDMIGNAPNAPDDLTIEGLSNGRFRLRWRYTKDQQEVTPTGFKIYMDSGSGFDFEAPVDTVSYGFGGTGEFEWTSDPLVHGQVYRFCVRTYTTGAGQTQNTDYVSGTADDEGPAAMTGLQASFQEL